MLPGPTATKFGRNQSPAPVQMHRLTVHDGSPLREIIHDIPIGVLDQEDLYAQDIDTSELVPGAAKVPALGSCTCQAGTGHLAERLAAAGRPLSCARLDTNVYVDPVLSATDPRACEIFAILLYHLVTDGTGDPASEWPPNDCGSSGYYVCAELERLKLAASYRAGSGVLGALALLQHGTVMQGLPWFNSWMTPDSQGFIDGDGSYDALMAAVESGVAGGHETLQRAIVQLAQAKTGAIDLHQTVIRCRNSWSTAWNPAYSGEFYVHASTLNYVAQYADFKQIVI